jgi:hypothetical protein
LLTLLDELGLFLLTAGSLREYGSDRKPEKAEGYGNRADGRFHKLIISQCPSREICETTMSLIADTEDI